MNRDEYMWEMLHRSACVFHAYRFDEATLAPMFVDRPVWQGTARELVELVLGDKSQLTFEERLLVNRSPSSMRNALERLEERYGKVLCESAGVYTVVWTLRAMRPAKEVA